MTFVTAIFAVLRIPQRTLDIARHHSGKGRGGETCGPEVGLEEIGIDVLEVRILGVGNATSA
jgi:hypothetical protein